MKIIAGIIWTALIFSGCNDIKEEDNIPTSKVELLTALEETEEEPKTDTAQSSTQPAATGILLKARGSEPGWYAEFYADKVKLQLDHGKITDELGYDFSKVILQKNADFGFTALKPQNGIQTKTKLLITIKSETCREESTGTLHDRSITLTYNGTPYYGCAFTEK